MDLVEEVHLFTIIFRLNQFHAAMMLSLQAGMALLMSDSPNRRGFVLSW